MANGGLITDYISYGSGAPSGAPDVVSGEYAFYQDTDDGSIYVWNLSGTPAWTPLGGAVSGTPDFGAAAIKTLASDVATLGSDRNVAIAAQSGTADNLIELSGLSVGESVIVYADAGDTITVKHNDAGATDKILLAGAADYALTGNQALILTKIASGKVVQAVDQNTGGGSITTASAFLSGNVTMTSANTFYDGPSVSLAAGTWMVWAGVDCYNAGSGSNFTAKIWDGTTPYVAMQSTNAGGGFHIGITLASPPIVLGSTTTIKVSVASQSASSTIYATPPQNNTGLTNLGSWIHAIKVA